MTVAPLAAPEDQLPDGVYLDLEPEVYFAQDRLGSSDLMDLFKLKSGWWWKSRHNPDQLIEVIDEETGEVAWVPKRPETTAQNYGSALHALMLEGVGAYERRFVVEPDYSRISGLLTTTAAIKRALCALPGYEPVRGRSEWKAEDWLAEARGYMPGRPLLADMREDFRLVAGKRKTVSAVEDRMLRIMHRAAIDPNNPDNAEVRELLGGSDGFPTLAEVSILYTDHLGLKRRARLDRLAPQFTADLKSLGNWQGRPLRFSLNDHVRREGLDIQLADQHNARRVMNRWLIEGEDRLHGGSIEHRAWLLAIARRGLEWDWSWLFYQKPDAGKGLAPILFPLFDLWKSAHHREGLRKALWAVDFYAAQVARFGLDQPWVVVEGLHYTDENLVPSIAPGFNPVAAPAHAREEEFLER